MRASNLFASYRKSINYPYGPKDLLVLLLTAVLLVSIPAIAITTIQNRSAVSKASTAPFIYVSPVYRPVNQNADFAIRIRVNSQGIEINSVQANLSYDSSRLNFVSIDSAGSAFNLEFQNQGGSGSVKIARSSTSPLTGDLLVATINFRSSSIVGRTDIRFAPGTVLVSLDKNVDVLGSKGSGIIEIRDNAVDPDSDGDGFIDSVEVFVGTDPNKACSDTNDAGDETIDAWPPDFNDDKKVDDKDTNSFGKHLLKKKGDPAYNVRYDLDKNGRVDIGDVIKVAPYYGESCQ
ncbi:MAG: hypothetical protein WD187_00130 [Candidatus Woykebacteria bacterium]